MLPPEYEPQGSPAKKNQQDKNECVSITFAQHPLDTSKAYPKPDQHPHEVIVSPGQSTGLANTSSIECYWLA